MLSKLLRHVNVSTIMKTYAQGCEADIHRRESLLMNRGPIVSRTLHPSGDQAGGCTARIDCFDGTSARASDLVVCI